MQESPRSQVGLSAPEYKLVRQPSQVRSRACLKARPISIIAVLHPPRRMLSHENGTSHEDDGERKYGLPSRECNSGYRGS